MRDWSVKEIYRRVSWTSFQLPTRSCCRFTTYQDARRVRLVDGPIFETNILKVSLVKDHVTKYYHRIQSVVQPDSRARLFASKTSRCRLLTNRPFVHRMKGKKLSKKLKAKNSFLVIIWLIIKITLTLKKRGNFQVYWISCPKLN